MKNPQLAAISNQILLALSTIQGSDPTTEEVRKHVRALADIWGGVSAPPVRETMETPAETPDAKYPPQRYTLPQQPTMRPSARPSDAERCVKQQGIPSSK